MSARASITLRLTVLFATVSTAVLLALGYLIGSTVEAHFVEQDVEVLSGKLDLTRHALAKVRSAAKKRQEKRPKRLPGNQRSKTSR